MSVKKKEKASKKVIWIIGICILLVAAFGCYWFFFRDNKKSEKVDSGILTATVQKSSQLTSSTITYDGIYHYNDSGFAFVNRSDFYIVYEAKAWAGVDLSKVTISADDEQKIIHITIPQATIEDVNINTDSVEFHDVGFSPFNWDARDDENKALGLAKDDATEKLKSMGITELANTSAADTIKGLIYNLVPSDYTFDIVQEESSME